MLPCDGTTSGHTRKNNSKFNGFSPRHPRRTPEWRWWAVFDEINYSGIGNRTIGANLSKRLDDRVQKEKVKGTFLRTIFRAIRRRFWRARATPSLFGREKLADSSPDDRLGNRTESFVSSIVCTRRKILFHRSFRIETEVCSVRRKKFDSCRSKPRENAWKFNFWYFERRGKGSYLKQNFRFLN